MTKDIPLDPDPDKREWVYDGYGVKRYRDDFSRPLESEVCPTCKKIKMKECELLCCPKS